MVIVSVFQFFVEDHGGEKLHLKHPLDDSGPVAREDFQLVIVVDHPFVLLAHLVLFHLTLDLVNPLPSKHGI